VTLTSRLFPSGSLIVAHPTASSTPLAWALRDLGLSLTDNWSVAWKPPFSTHLYVEPSGVQCFDESNPLKDDEASA